MLRGKPDFEGKTEKVTIQNRIIMGKKDIMHKAETCASSRKSSECMTNNALHGKTLDIIS